MACHQASGRGRPGPLALRLGLRRLLAGGLAVWLAGGLTGCSSTLDVRSLATERADVSAFELTGRDLAALRREASQLCPQGGEILRQSAREQRLEAVDSGLERWVQLSSTWITPPERLAVHVHPERDLERRVTLFAGLAGEHLA